MQKISKKKQEDAKEQAQIRLALLQAMPTDVLYENIIIALIDLTKQFANDMVYGVKE